MRVDIISNLDTSTRNVVSFKQYGKFSKLFVKRRIVVFFLSFAVLSSGRSIGYIAILAPLPPLPPLQNFVGMVQTYADVPVDKRYRQSYKGRGAL